MTPDDKRAAVEVMAKGTANSTYVKYKWDQLGKHVQRMAIEDATAAIAALETAGYRILPPGWPDDAAVERADNILRTLMVGTDNEPLDAMRAALLAAVKEPPK